MANQNAFLKDEFKHIGYPHDRDIHDSTVTSDIEFEGFVFEINN